MKKLLSAGLTFCLVVGLFAGTGLTPPAQAAGDVWGGDVAATYTDGDGSAASPYQIATGAQLAYLAQQVNAGTDYSGVYFLMTSDIDLNSASWTPIGLNSTHAFRGSFDGGGHAVSGLNVNATYSGLFGYIGSGTVKNLSASGAASSSGGGDAAVIAGFNIGTILNCYSTGTAIGLKVGGIVGENSGTIQNCYSTCAVSRTGTTSTYVGGISGFNRGTIQNCYWLGGTAASAVGTGSGTDSSSFDSTGALASSVSYGSTLLVALNGWAAAQTTPSDYFSWKTSGGGYPVFAAVCGGTAAAPYAGGDGSAGNPYLIESAAQLYHLAQLVNLGNTAYNAKSYRLAADIDLGNLSWTPIGNAGNRFKGSFEGGGHTVSGLDVNANYAGLFGYIDGGTVKSLSVSGAVSGSGTDYGIVGGVAGAVSGGSTIQNCSSTCTITGDDLYTGGVAGSVNGSAMQNCYNTGMVTGNYYIGGVAGYVYSSAAIQSCYNTGAVTGSGYAIAGGVVGYVSGSAAIQSCYNTGAVAGGTVSNAGGISSTIGGVAGNVSGGTIQGCYNTGAVTGGTGTVTDGIGSTSSTTGGLAGYVGNGTIKGCYNTGVVTGGNGAVSSTTGSNIGGTSSTTGGLAGTVGGGTIQSCYSAGAVAGGNGTVTGKTGSNTGGTSSNTGGLTGYVTSGTIQNCYWLGAVTGGNGTVTGKTGGTSSTTGGLAGNVGSGTIQNCYWRGTVTGGTGTVTGGTGTISSTTGGLAGSVGGGTIQNCYWPVAAAASAIGTGSGTDISSFDSTGALASSVSYGGTLLAALNGWVAAQTTPGSYFSWTAVSGVNDGYPIQQFFEATPCATINYQAEKLTGLIGGAAYSVGGVSYTASAGGVLSIDGAWFGQTRSIVKKGDGSATLDSAAQSLDVPARPPVPTGVTGGVGSIPGVSAAMEYSKDGTSWTACAGPAVTGLSAGTYHVRYQAVTGTSFASVAADVTVTAATYAGTGVTTPSYNANVSGTDASGKALSKATLGVTVSQSQKNAVVKVSSEQSSTIMSGGTLLVTIPTIPNVTAYRAFK